jgi:hypothetical protein
MEIKNHGDKIFSSYLNKNGRLELSKKAPNNTKRTRSEGCKSKRGISIYRNMYGLMKINNPMKCPARITRSTLPK